MARIRSIKPEFFDDPDIGQLSAEAALFFIGILTQADKAGRLLDEPRRLKVRIRPYSDCNPEAILTELSDAGFIIRYTASDNKPLIQVRSFLKHQRPHPKEAESELDAPNLEDCSVKTESREKVVPSREKDMASKVVSGGRKESLEVGREGEWSIDAESASVPAAPRRNAKPDSDYSPDFISAWEAYPRKVGKADAARAWKRQRPVLAVVLSALDWQRRQPQWARDNGEYIPHMSTWINRAGWEDEPPQGASAATSARREIGAWTTECNDLHGGTCGNQHFHFSRMKAAQVAS